MHFSFPSHKKKLVALPLTLRFFNGFLRIIFINFHFWTLNKNSVAENIYSFRPANAQGNIFSFDIKKARGLAKQGCREEQNPL
jgi:hypothetical protein